MSSNVDTNNMHVANVSSRGFAFGYRMPSENRYPFNDNENENENEEQRKIRVKCFNLISTTRQNAQKLAQSKGLLATTSLVLCSDKRTKQELLDVKSQIEESYRELNEYLKSKGFDSIGEPVVKAIPLVQTQFIDLAEIAKANFLDKLTAQIERYSKTLKEIDQMPDEKKKALTYRVGYEKRDLEEVTKLASEIGIDLTQTTILNNLMLEAIGKLSKAN